MRDTITEHPVHHNIAAEIPDQPETHILRAILEWLFGLRASDYKNVNSAHHYFSRCLNKLRAKRDVYETGFLQGCSSEPSASTSTIVAQDHTMVPPYVAYP